MDKMQKMLDVLKRKYNRVGESTSLTPSQSLSMPKQSISFPKMKVPSIKKGK